jgi:transaldolase
LSKLGQAIWLDDIHRDYMTSGRLKQLIDQDGLRGMTSNPAIFRKAISESSDYDDDIQQLKRQGKSAKEIFEALAVKDVQMAADVFRPVYDSTDGEHGYVSLEVNPHLAHYAQGTIEEAQRLWTSVARPNIFIKVPATEDGLLAITTLIGQGINVNVTLLFGLPRYGEVADAYIAGLERRAQSSKPLKHVRSVASFFLSRIDVLLDARLETVIAQGGRDASLARELKGEIAVASARAAYQMYQEIISGERWKRLAEAGANPQWLLWASTSTKNPEDNDLKYVEPLIGRDTINTLPMKTLDAYRDHGDPHRRLGDDVEAARRSLAQLSRLGLEIDEATQQLEDEGVEKFCRPFDALLKKLKEEITLA